MGQDLRRLVRYSDVTMDADRGHKPRLAENVADAELFPHQRKSPAVRAEMQSVGGEAGYVGDGGAARGHRVERICGHFRQLGAELPGQRRPWIAQIQFATDRTDIPRVGRQTERHERAGRERQEDQRPARQGQGSAAIERQ